MISVSHPEKANHMWMTLNHKSSQWNKHYTIRELEP